MEINRFKTIIDKHDVFCIEYNNNHEYTISDIKYPSEGNGRKCFDCWCIDRDGKPINEERTFRVEFIEHITVMDEKDENDTSESRFIWLQKNYNILFMGYTNVKSDYHEMNISNIEYPSIQYGEGYFDAFVIDEDGEEEGLERTFKIERIDFIQPSDVEGYEDDYDE